jgi:imidazolonepropionase-like amidohydrolase
MLRSFKSAALASAALAAIAFAAPAYAETIAIVHGEVFTEGQSGHIHDGTVVIRDGKIAEVGSNVSVPSGARVIDAKGQPVTPGLIVSDSRIGAEEVSSLGNDLTVRGADIGAAFDAQYGLDPDTTLIPVARLGGITGAIVTPLAPGRGFGGADRDELEDYTAGAGGTGGTTTTATLFAGQAAVVDLAEGARDMVVKAHVAMVAPLGEEGARLSGGARGAEFVELKIALDDVRWFMKNRAAYDHGQAPHDLHMSRADLEALIPVVEGRMPLLMSVDRASDIRDALKLAREEHFKLIIDGGAEGWRVADEIAAAHVPVIVYPLDDLPSDFQHLGSTLENAGRLSAAGVQVAFTSAEGGAHRARELRYDAGNAVAHGMGWDAALAAVTVNAAKIFGVADRMGSLEPGKDADVVVWSGDPFEPLSQPVAVIIKGAEQPLTSRQMELQHRYMSPTSNGYPVQYKDPH